MMAELRVVGEFKVVGFAVAVVDDKGNRSIVYSDKVNYGSCTLLAEVLRLEGEDTVVADLAFPIGYEIKLFSSSLNIRKDSKNISEYIEGDGPHKQLEDKTGQEEEL